MKWAFWPRKRWIAASHCRSTGRPSWVALSGQGRSSGSKAQALGGRHICDRGSSHIRYQDELLREEHKIWAMPYAGIDPRTIDKEETEYAKADLITVPSGFAERSFLRKGVGAPRSCAGSPMGRGWSGFSPPACLRSRPSRSSSWDTSRSARGYLTCSDAFSMFDHPNKRLLIIGNVDESMPPMLVAHADDRIEFLGNVSNERLPGYYSKGERAGAAKH